jgi:hypothetical protein
LFGLLLFYALVNYLLNSAGVLTGPLVLSVAGAATLGTVQSVMGVGMLLGSLTASTWKGTRRKIHTVLGAILVAGAGLALAGLRPSPLVMGAGLFILLLPVPIAGAASQTIFQSKVDPAVQGRVFSIRSMIATSMTPLAFLTAGPLADQVFGPPMTDPRSGLAAAAARLIGSGPGRGIGLMFVLAGGLLWLVTGLVLRDRRIRRVEVELPDVLPARPEQALEAALGARAPEPAV